LALRPRPADDRAGLRDAQAGHLPASAGRASAGLGEPDRAAAGTGGGRRGGRTVVADISARSSPRRAASSSGRLIDFRPATVAWTMLIGLDEPSDLERPCVTPAHA